MIEATPRSSSYSARWHKLSLQTQVRTSFGISTVVALLAVFFIALGVSSDASGKIKVSARAALTAQTERNMQSVSQQAAETVARFLDNLEGSVGILEQATLDLVNDYPTNFDSADNVPFVDASSGALRYPLQVPPAVSDVSGEWAAAYMIDSVKATSDPSGVAELAPGRDFVRMYGTDTISVERATLFYRGSCDASAEAGTPGYVEGCSSDNNDFETGGVGNAATPTAGGLAQVVPALEYFFKPLWEAHADVMTIYLGLANSGAGAFLQFPAQVPRSLGTYSSIGCAWAVSAGVLTLSETDRCNAEGAQVGSRDYNPLERGWCRDQVENRGYSRNDGPYLDATAEHLWVMTVGKAVFDRKSGNLIGCLGIDVTIDQLTSIIDGVSLGETGSAALVRWNPEGTVVASSSWDHLDTSSRSTIGVLDLGTLDGQTWAAMLDSEVPVSHIWRTTAGEAATFVTRYPVPLPDPDNPSRAPDFMIILSISEAEVLKEVDEMDATVDEDVMNSIIVPSLLVVLLTAGVTFAIILCVSKSMTRPLTWMSDVAEKITGNAGGSLGAGVHGDFPHSCQEDEIHDLVKEFQTMVRKLGGDGAAKTVGDATGLVPNPFDRNKVAALAGKAGIAEVVPTADQYAVASVAPSAAKVVGRVELTEMSNGD